MTPSRTSPKGSFRIDMRVPSVGRLWIASGARTKGEYTKRLACLVKCRDTGRLDILRAIKNHQLTVTEVYAADMAGRLGFVLADIVLQRPLWEAVQGWLPRSAKGKATRTRYTGAWEVVKKAGVVRPSAQVRDLRSVDWQRWSIRWTQSAAHWNHVRRAVSKFLSDQIGKHHPFRHEVLETFPATKERKRMPDLSVAEFWTVANHLPEEYRAVYVTLVTTGLRVGELLACSDLSLRHANHEIRVPGTKTPDAWANIPVHAQLWDYVRAAIPCPFTHWQLWRRWVDACDATKIPRTTLHDLRHCTGQWLTQAGRPEASVQAMLRHSDPRQTRDYTMVVLKREDADAMRRILGKGA